MTAAQLRALEALHTWAKSHRYAPSFRDLAAVLGFSSTNAVSCVLAALRREGFVDSVPGVARSLFVTSAGRRALRQPQTFEANT